MISRYQETHLASHGRIHEGTSQNHTLAQARAPFHESGAHTAAGARFQGTGRPILPPMAESMRGPLKIVPSPKRQHHFTRTMPIPQREPHFHTPRTPHFRHMSRESAPGAGGLATGSAPAPCLFLAFSTPQATKSKHLYHRRTPCPRGRRTSPACGSCRRPLCYQEEE